MPENDNNANSIAARHKHSIRCFPCSDQELALSKANRSSEQKADLDELELPRLIVHFYTSQPTMSVFIPGLIQEFSRLLFDIEVLVKPQSATASKMLSIVKRLTDSKRISDPNNNSQIETDSRENSIQSNKVKNETDKDWSTSIEGTTEMQPKKKHGKISPTTKDNYKFYPSYSTNDGSHVPSFQRRRRVADSDSNLTSNKENFYKFTIEINCPNQEVPAIESNSSTFQSSITKSTTDRFYSTKTNLGAPNRNAKKSTQLSLNKKSLNKRRGFLASSRSVHNEAQAKQVISCAQSDELASGCQQQPSAVSATSFEHHESNLAESNTINNFKARPILENICAATCRKSSLDYVNANVNSQQIRNAGSLENNESMLTQSNSLNDSKRICSQSSQGDVENELSAEKTEINLANSSQRPRLPNLSKLLLKIKIADCLLLKCVIGL